MRYSKQRELIESAVKNNRIHPTADDIYTMLKPNNPGLSLGTVYRNLNALAEHGVIRKLPMPNGSDRFDGELSEHYHVICSECGKIFDIELSLMSELDEKIKKQTGVTAVSHQLIINGVCEDCKK